jgi:hypothetical protein
MVDEAKTVERRGHIPGFCDAALYSVTIATGETTVAIKHGFMKCLAGFATAAEDLGAETVPELAISGATATLTGTAAKSYTVLLLGM